MRVFGIAPVALIATFMFASPALAQDEEEEDPSSIEISGNATLVTDYRFRGVTFSDEDLSLIHI